MKKIFVILLILCNFFIYSNELSESNLKRNNIHEFIDFICNVNQPTIMNYWKFFDNHTEFEYALRIEKCKELKISEDTCFKYFPCKDSDSSMVLLKVKNYFFNEMRIFETELKSKYKSSYLFDSGNVSYYSFIKNDATTQILVFFIMDAKPKTSDSKIIDILDNKGNSIIQKTDMDIKYKERLKNFIKNMN